jgi:SAM-dependent methyltransferase
MKKRIRDRIKENLVGQKYYTRQERAAYTINRFLPYLAGRMLDIGSGGAGLCTHLEDCVSIDINPAAAPDVFVNLDKGYLPFASNSVDCVVCTDVLEHLENLHRVFQEAVRVSCEYVIVSMPNNWLAARGTICSGDHRHPLKYYGLPLTQPSDRHRWFFSYTESEDFVQGMAAAMGLQVLCCEPFFAARDQIKAALLRPFISSRRANNLFASTLWAVLRKPDGRQLVAQSRSQ